MMDSAKRRAKSALISADSSARLREELLQAAC